MRRIDHEWWRLSARLYRCRRCGQGRASLPLIGIWRPWPGNCRPDR